MSKDVANLVSDADIEAEHAIAAVIKQGLPLARDPRRRGPRSATSSAEHLWIIDPIDGTNNFAHQIPHFAVSVAYYRPRRQAQCGVVFNPVRDEWHSAARGQGGLPRRPDRVAASQAATRLDEVLVGVGFYYDRGAMMEVDLRCGRRTQAQA